MSALDVQHGGSHYKNRAVQPVEFWKSNLMGGDEGACVKYVTRWRDKSGVMDLLKGRHFIQLILEDKAYQELFAKNRMAFPAFNFKGISADEYIDANGMENPEAGVIRHVWLWNRTAKRSDLEGALKWIDEAILMAMSEMVTDSYQAIFDFSKEASIPSDAALRDLWEKVCQTHAAAMLSQAGKPGAQPPTLGIFNEGGDA